MPAFRIVYSRGESESPEAIIASFNDLDQALGVFAARGLHILYIAEQGTPVDTAHEPQRRPIGRLVECKRRDAAPPARSNSFPLHRFSGRVMA